MRSMLSILRRLSCSPLRKVTSCLALASGGAAAAAFAYGISQPTQLRNVPFMPLVVNCASKFNPQSSVRCNYTYYEQIINENKNHALYLTIHLNPSANAHDCLKALGKIQQCVDEISPPSLRDETDEIWYGVGFGPEYMNKLQSNGSVPGTQFSYRTRSGALGEMPNTGGDIFIHAKCNEVGKLFELAQAVLKGLPSQSVSKFEDVYGWVYRNGRDLSGFIDGTENPADTDERTSIAIDPKTGGSYAITQRWVHNYAVIDDTQDHAKSHWIGRNIADSTELKKKSETSHVARMVGSSEFEAEPKYQIVRHSQPYGTLSGDSGLFFIAYSASPAAFDWMLDRMTGHGDDKLCDDVMRMTRCVSGNYWYFPSLEEFERMTKASHASFRLWG